jgi:hypothetical protein
MPSRRSARPWRRSVWIWSSQTTGIGPKIQNPPHLSPMQDAGGGPEPPALRRRSGGLIGSVIRGWLLLWGPRRPAGAAGARRQETRGGWIVVTNTGPFADGGAGTPRRQQQAARRVRMDTRAALRSRNTAQGAERQSEGLEMAVDCHLLAMWREPWELPGPPEVVITTPCLLFVLRCVEARSRRSRRLTTRAPNANEKYKHRPYNNPLLRSPTTSTRRTLHLAPTVISHPQEEPSCTCTCDKLQPIIRAPSNA